jgi:membrane fusion protein (multidrug efflux system)
MKARTKAWVTTIVALFIVFGAVAGIKAAQIGAMIESGKAFAPPPEMVASTRAELIQRRAATSAVGTLVAVRAVTLGAELPGTVRAITFDSGTSVKTGDVLVKLDTSAEEAQLAAADADAMLAKTNLEREQKLSAEGAGLPADLDAAKARSKQTEANVSNLRATLAKKVVRAPFDGRIAIRQVELGQVLGGGSPIASLTSVSPIYAEFWLPEQALAELTLGQHARIRSDAFPDARWDGEVTTINPEVDAQTHNVRVRGTFANDDGRLRPGMFVKVEVFSRDERESLVIPQTAIIYAPYGDSVFVLEEQKGDAGKAAIIARQRFVRLGERYGDFVAVTSGLSPGETVVRDGAFKLRNGSQVTVNNELSPDAALAPRPREE